MALNAQQQLLARSRWRGEARGQRDLLVVSALFAAILFTSSLILFTFVCCSSSLLTRSLYFSDLRKVFGKEDGETARLAIVIPHGFNLPQSENRYSDETKIPQYDHLSTVCLYINRLAALGTPEKMVAIVQNIGSSLLVFSAFFNAATPEPATSSTSSTSSAPSSSSSSPSSAAETPSWQQYIQGPSSTNVLPIAVLSGSVTGSVTNPDGLLASGGASAQLFAPALVTPPSWPSGTTANASSSHASNVGGGVTRTYEAGNAIDGDVSTFWNDDTIGEYPDILTIISTSAVSLAGLTLVSQADGVPVDLKVEYLKADNTWATGGTVTGNADVQFKVPFSSTVSTKMVKITVTKDQAVSVGEYTRISEVYPGLVDTVTKPSLIVDFGKVVVGFLNIAFSGASNNKPGIQLAFSETTEFLTTISDFTRSDNVRQFRICKIKRLMTIGGYNHFRN